MIVRNMDQKKVQAGLFSAHGGGVAAMLLDSSVLQGMLFLSQGILPPGKAIEAHADPYEEIYYLLQGEGLMRVGADQQRVGQGDAILIPRGSLHGMENDGERDCTVLIVAAMPRMIENSSWENQRI